MTAKKITKQQLYDFIEKQVSTQESLIQKEIDTRIDSAVNPILESWINFSEIETLADQLANRLDSAKEVTPYADSWTYQSVTSDLNRTVTTMTKRIRNNVRNEIRNFVHEPHNTALDTGKSDLNEIAFSLQKEAEPLRKKRADLKKLYKELKNAIAVEPNGSRAYKALVALGVDMKDFESTDSMLPAVVKLSVNPCLLTGDCN